MQISDIIKSDADRVFYVDSECFIIFTGDSETDQKPFIRIGNWINLPSELIPYIENIIIPDSLPGNPQHEQFNLNISELSTNRFIGSRGVVKKFFEYQKNFNLDLTNASVVDIESDIPELSKEKNLSAANEYIGVFYNNGNFKTVHQGRTLFDLDEAEKTSYSQNRIFSAISQIASQTRYNGTGFVSVNNSLFIYSNSSFISFDFPIDSFINFSRLSINPAGISEIFLLNKSLTPVIPFLKWKSYQQNKIKIHSDDIKSVESIKKLYSSSYISVDKISSGSFSLGQEMKIDALPLRGCFKLHFLNPHPTGKELTAVLIKENSSISRLIKEKSDLIITDYSIYESSVMLFRNCGKPVIIIDDGSKNTSKIKKTGEIIIREGIQYEIQYHKDLDTIFPVCSFDESILSILLTEDSEKVDEIIKIITKSNPENKNSNLFNTANLIKIIIDKTTSRKFSLKLKTVSAEIRSRIHEKEIQKISPAIKVVIVFFNKQLYEFITDERFKPDLIYYDDIKAPEEFSNESPPGVKEFHSLVMNDRMRLKMLLNIFLDSPGIKSGISDNLSRIISERKKEFMNGSASTIQDDDENKPSSSKINFKTISLIAILIILISAAGFLYYKNKPDLSSVIKIERNTPVKTINSIAEEHGIIIDDTDIYEYANLIAVKNGFRKIIKGIIQREKNPDWIYPGNIFLLHDDEKITVKKGDTLWAISRRKLIESEINFNKIFTQIKNSSSTASNVELDELNKFALTSKSKEAISEYILSVKKENGKKQ
jgi:hypothetical protein